MKKNRNKKNYFNRPTKNLLIVLGVLFVSLLALNYLTRYSMQTKIFSYSNFLKAVEEGKVESINVSGQDARGKLKEGSFFETVLANSPDVWKDLQKNNVDISIVSPGNQSTIWYIISTLFGLLLLLAFWYNTRISRSSGNNSGMGGGGGVFGMGKSRARMFLPSEIKVNFDSVAGAGEAKEELKDVVDFLKDPEKYSRLGAKMTRGVLLVGEPGNGKTLLAKAVAGEANCPFFSISGSDFIEVFVGVGASRVRDLFAKARQHSPSIVFIDEIDAVGRQRGSGMGGGHDEREQTLNQLLTEMDGFQGSDSTVIVIAATNRPDVLDKALLRPGRFDRHVTVPYPDLQSRKAILELHAKRVKLDPEVDLEKIARGTPRFSGADLANIINEAAIIASKTDQKTIKIADFEEARDKIMLGKEIKSMQQTHKDLEMTAYHEAGHAMVALMMPEHSDPLHKVTIIPRGRALGVTHSLPEREKYSMNKEELIAHIMKSLGGRAAEELVFNTYTTGAYSDFVNSTSMARDMVCLYGMSDNLGPVVYRQGYGEFEYSQETAKAIDEEVKKLVQDLYRKVMDLLTQNREKLDTLAQELLEKETLYSHEIYELLGIEPRVDHSFAPKGDGIQQSEQDVQPVTVDSRDC